MTKSWELGGEWSFNEFKEAVEKSHRMMLGQDIIIEHLPVDPGNYPCIAVAGTTFKTKERIVIGYIFVREWDFSGDDDG